MQTKRRIVNFVSEVRNIGNLIAVQGIDEMLDPAFRPALRIDCRRFPQVHIDKFDLALVGGAGLFHRCFADFWAWLSLQRIPVMIWGVGVCLPTDHPSVSDTRRSGVPREHVDRLRGRLVFCNVRDDLTQQTYSLEGSVTACPSVVYVQNQSPSSEPRQSILYSHHPELVTESEKETIAGYCNDFTDNLFDHCDPVDVLAKFRRARVVVTSRLHGAILAAALGRPYVALSRDRKLHAFLQQFGGGVALEDVSGLGTAISTASMKAVKPLDSADIRKAGVQANRALNDLFG